MYLAISMGSRIKKVLIVGALGGLGGATVRELTSIGYFVFAADINTKVLEEYANDSLVYPLVMDISDPISVDNTFKLISSQTSELDAIIHMAGVLAVGSVVEVEIDEIRKVLDINFFGVFQVNKKFFPMLINNKGKIVILSSETGVQTAAPFNGIYALTKYALEAYSDALRRELSFLEIKVIKIRPGAFKTSMTKGVEDLFESAEQRSFWFKKNINKGRSYLPSVYKKARDPKLLARKIANICKMQNPKTAYSFHPDLKRTLLEWLPIKWADKLIKKMLS